jgi:hypothetical protein
MNLARCTTRSVTFSVTHSSIGVAAKPRRGNFALSETNMHRWFFGSTLLFTLSSLAFGFDDTEKSSHWLKDYDEAREAARKLDKPIFLVFRCER